MIKINKKISIFGTGGLGKESLLCLTDSLLETNYKINDIANFVVSDDHFSDTELMGVPIIPLSDFNHKEFDIIIALGDPDMRKEVFKLLPKESTFATIIHPSVKVPNSTKVGEGSILTAGSIISLDTEIGKHAHINLNSTIGHDCLIGDFFTASPGVNISGNCNIGDSVTFGTNSAVRQGVSICSNVTIGMGSIVIANIDKKGTYFGNPSRKMR